jgi:hypothetical protein
LLDTKDDTTSSGFGALTFKLPVKTINININGDDTTSAKLVENKIVANSTEGKDELSETSVTKEMLSRATIADDDTTTTRHHKHRKSNLREHESSSSKS